MRKITTKILAAMVLFLVVFTSIFNKKYKFEASISQDILKASNLAQKKDINDELLDISMKGKKNVNIYVDNNIISFDKSNTTTELSYATYNIIANSDKTTWNIITNNFVENYTVNNNQIILDDEDFNTVSFSFIYNDIQYNLSLVKEDNGYTLKESTVKLIHGSYTSLWYEYFNDLNTAVERASNNDYIVLYDDQIVDKTIDINKNITILSNPGNIYTVFNNDNYLFNMNNGGLTINNVLLVSNSFIKGKTKKNIVLNNSKVNYSDRLYPKKSKLNKRIKTEDQIVFIKASL